MAEELDRFQEERRKSIRLTLAGLISALVLGTAALIATQDEGVMGVMGIGAMVFLAAFAVGCVLGFLFAVPRVLSESATPIDQAESGDAAGSPSATEASISRRVRGRLLGSNTNLERISDWLTTMLVGVGLSQIGSVPDGLNRFSAFLEHQCPAQLLTQAGKCTSVLPTIGPMILIFGLVLGFLFLYLFTRLVIVTLLNDVERVIDGGANWLKIEDEGARTATFEAAASLRQVSENPTVRSVDETSAVSVEQSLSVMNAYLYEPGGFNEVIALGDRLSRTAAVKAAEYWVYLAAAFGQKHHQLKDDDGSRTERGRARNSALACVRQAVRLKPNTRDWLWSLSDPEGDDRDLQDFRKDPEFLAAVGRK